MFDTISNSSKSNVWSVQLNLLKTLHLRPNHSGPLRNTFYSIVKIVSVGESPWVSIILANLQTLTNQKTEIRLIKKNKERQQAVRTHEITFSAYWCCMHLHSSVCFRIQCTIDNVVWLFILFGHRSFNRDDEGIIW